MERGRGLVIGWMPRCSRCDELGRLLDCDVVLFARPGFRRPWSAPFLYPVLAIRSVALLLRRRPRSVVVVAPPFLAGLVIVPVAKLLGAGVAVDIHSGALVEPIWRFSLPILHWICRLAGNAIVTLPSLAARLEMAGVSAMVIPGVIPNLPEARHGGGSEAAVVVAICGWGSDEPIEQLAQAARGRPWTLLITGRPKWFPKLLPNVRLTGMLSDAAYAALLGDASALVVLTTRDDTVLSGAWEALAVGRPLVLSGTAALRATFGEEVTYVEPTARSIAAGVDYVLARQREAAAISVRLAETFRTQQAHSVEALRARLSPA